MLLLEESADYKVAAYGGTWLRRDRHFRVPRTCPIDLDDAFKEYLSNRGTKSTCLSGPLTVGLQLVNAFSLYLNSYR